MINDFLAVPKTSINSKNKVSLIGSLVLISMLVYPFAILTYYRIYFLVIIAASLIVAIMYLRTLRYQKVANNTSIYLFFMLMISSYVWSHYPGYTLYSIFSTFPFLLLFYIASFSIKRERSFFEIMVISLPIVYGVLFIIIFLKYGSIRVTNMEMSEVLGSFSGTAPAIVVVCLPYLISMILLRKKWLVSAASIIFVIFVIVASQSRGALLMTLVTLLLVPLLFGRDIATKMRLLLKMLIVASLVVISTMIVFDDTISIILNRSQDSQVYFVFDSDEPIRRETDYGRAVMYFEGISVIKNYPSFGIGYGGLSPHIEGLYGFPMVSHNIIVTVWGEMGIAGLIIFILMIGSAVQRLILARKWTSHYSKSDCYYYSASLVGLIILLLHGMTRPLLTNPMFYILLAIAFTVPVKGPAIARRHTH